MAATKRMTKGEGEQIYLPVTGAIVIEQGTLLFRGEGGYLTPHFLNDGSRPFVGFASNKLDNSVATTGGTAGAISGIADQTCFSMSASITITNADVGKSAWQSTTSGCFTTVSGTGLPNTVGTRLGKIVCLNPLQPNHAFISVSDNILVHFG